MSSFEMASYVESDVKQQEEKLTELKQWMESELKWKGRKASSYKMASYVESDVKQQDEKLTELKEWMKSELKWKGRKDEQFVIMCLRSNEYDVDKAKKTVFRFYENKMKIPEWWTNRDVEDPLALAVIDKKGSTIMIEKEDNPCVIIGILSRVGPRSNSHLLDTCAKLGTLVLETVLQRPSSHKNGIVYVLDCRDYPWWPVAIISTPSIIKNAANSFYYDLPLKVSKLVVLNAPILAYFFMKIVKHIVATEIYQVIHLLGSDWSTLPDLVPKEMLPEEYGGEAGPFDVHYEAMLNEIKGNLQYFDDDNDDL